MKNHIQTTETTPLGANGKRVSFLKMESTPQETTPLGPNVKRVLHLETLSEEINKAFSDIQKATMGWVMAGYKLHQIKSELPHGQFATFCEENFPKISRQHLYNAMMVADYIAQALLGGNILASTWCKMQPMAEIENQIQKFSNTGTRQLMLAAKEFRNDKTEQESKIVVEEFFEENPALREEWEYRILTGELTYTQAKMGIKGQEITKDKEKYEENPRKNFIEHIRKAPAWTKKIGAWSNLDNTQQDTVIKSLRDIVSFLPQSVRELIMNAKIDA